MPRALLHSYAGILSPVFVKLNGMPTEPAAPPTVTCTRLDGTVLAAPAVSTETELSGRYFAALQPAVHTNQLDRLKLVWTATVDTESVQAEQFVYVVSDMLVRPASLYGEPDMNSKAPWLLTLACEAINDYCEDYCNKAFGLRVEQQMIRRSQTRNGRFPLRWGYVQSLTAAAGDEIDVLDRLELVGSVLSTGWSSWPWDTLVVTYLHGQERFSQKLVWEALQAARQDVLSRSARTPRQAISETTAGTVVRYNTPDLMHARPTGYLTLDPVLEQERLPLGFA